MILFKVTNVVFNQITRAQSFIHKNFLPIPLIYTFHGAMEFPWLKHLRFDFICLYFYNKMIITISATIEILTIVINNVRQCSVVISSSD